MVGSLFDRFATIWRALALMSVAALVAGCAQPVSGSSGLLAGAFSGGAATPTALAQPAAMPLRRAPTPQPATRPDVPDWRWFFDDMSKGAILVNIDKRYLIYWSPGGMTYHPFPIAVPLDSDLTRVGRTKIVRKRENPDWRPTPDMRRRNPDLPEYVGPGPHNPLGEHALYLSWTYYAIHGTNTPGSIGTRATSGCFRMQPDDVSWLFGEAEIGTPVVVIQDLEPGQGV